MSWSRSSGGKVQIGYRTVYKWCLKVLKSLHWLLEAKVQMQSVKKGMQSMPYNPAKRFVLDLVDYMTTMTDLPKVISPQINEAKKNI